MDKQESPRPVALTGAAAPTPESESPRLPQVEVDDSKVTAAYANFCRVMGTPEELIIDFGLNSEPFGAPTEPLPISQRIVTNLYTAKRLARALELTIQRHETVFGAVETDVQKRARRS